jgi:hypothetical protein
MDYSLLVAVERQVSLENGMSTAAGCLRVYGGGSSLVHMGIIDFLQR